MTRKEIAVSRFKEGFSCAQAVFSTFAEALGFDRNAASKIAGGFGGGMGRMAGTCGALTGAFMAIGLKYGVTTPDREARQRTYALVRELAQQFRSRHNSLACKDLLGCDISTPEGFEQAKEKKLFATLCTKYVEEAAEILEQVLQL